jgi:NADPH-dependent 2,4-dienoyl-CoA reductase/sulfur reductase-like enzyme/rhodanese-related sulfurtransferase
MKVCIIGGVAGGATTATRLRRLDEKLDIVIFERGEYVSFANCGLPYYIGDKIQNKKALILQTPEKFKSRFNIDVRINSEVISIDKESKEITVKNVLDGTVYMEKYDKLVISTGAYPIIPNIEIEDKSKVFTLRTVPDTYKIKEYIEENNVKEATIIGGGYIGIEMAENLYNLGINVTIIEAKTNLIGPLDFEMANFLHKYLKEKGINLKLSSKVNKIKKTDDSVFVCFENKGNEEQIKTDLVILSIGVKPESKLAIDSKLKINDKGSIEVNEKMLTSNKDIYALGDVACVTNYITKEVDYIPLAGPANKQARVVANNICGINTKYNGTQGSSILKIFDMAVAVTGINEGVAKKLKLNYDKIYITPDSHATYYPGSKPMNIKVIYEKKKGNILGAQIVGYDMVDKRCDVIATAIRGGLNAYDLCELELCYAPPFSSAKDPVNIIGNVIVNILEKELVKIDSEDVDKYLDEKTILDVRTKKEYEMGHIKNAINIPVDSLRENLNKLDKKKDIIVYCRSGLRSYIAYKILINNGYTAYSLNGGYLMYESTKK